MYGLKRTMHDVRIYKQLYSKCISTSSCDLKRILLESSYKKSYLYAQYPYTLDTKYLNLRNYYIPY